MMKPKCELFHGCRAFIRVIAEINQSVLWGFVKKFDKNLALQNRTLWKQRNMLKNTVKWIQVVNWKTNVLSKYRT